MNNQDVELQYAAVLERLTMKQRKFLNARRNESTDDAAVPKAGCGTAVVSKWKKQPQFMAAYALATTVLCTNPKDIIIVPTESRQELIGGQLKALTEVLPRIVQEHIRIALEGEKDSDRIRAIESIYQAVGFNVEVGLPISKQNATFLAMLTLMRPQVAAEVQRRGLPSPDVIEGSFTATEKDKDEEVRQRELDKVVAKWEE